MSQWTDYAQEPKVLGASCMHPSKEQERLKEENHQLSQRVNELEQEKAKLEIDNKSLSKAVEHFDEEKGELKCQVDDLMAKLQDSTRYGVPLFFY